MRGYKTWVIFIFSILGCKTFNVTFKFWFNTLIEHVFYFFLIKLLYRVSWLYLFCTLTSWPFILFKFCFSLSYSWHISFQSYLGLIFIIDLKAPTIIETMNTFLWLSITYSTFFYIKIALRLSIWLLTISILLLHVLSFFIFLYC